MTASVSSSRTTRVRDTPGRLGRDAPSAGRGYGRRLQPGGSRARVIRQPVCQQDALFPDHVGRDHRCGIRGRVVVAGQRRQASITGQVQSIGTNLIFVMPGSVNARRPGQTIRGAEPDYGGLPGHQQPGLPLNGIAPQFSGSADIVAPAADKNATIAGTTPAYFAMQDLRPASGSLFDEGQSRAGAPVAVLGANLAKDLFGNGTAVGQTVRVKDQTLRVIGVLAAKGGGGMARSTISSSRRSASCKSACSGRARRTATATAWQTSCSRRATATTSKPSRIGSRSSSASAII